MQPQKFSSSTCRKIVSFVKKRYGYILLSPEARVRDKYPDRCHQSHGGCVNAVLWGATPHLISPQPLSHWTYPKFYENLNKNNIFRKNADIIIATKFNTWTDSTAVGSCVKFYGKQMHLHFSLIQLENVYCNEISKGYFFVKQAL